MEGVRRVLFGLPELRGQSVVYIVEGEKDVLNLRSIGVAATTNAGGAGKWRDEYTQQLLNAGVPEVVILPDNDLSGRQHAETVARSCRAAGLQAKIVTLPSLPLKGDVSDWLAAGHSRDDLVALVKGASVYNPTTNTAGSNDGHAGLELTSLSELLAETEESVRWLVDGRIATGSLNVLAGKPKAGKSTLARLLALEVARGGQWLGFQCEAALVWYLALEDKRSEVRRHFRAMNATGAESLRLVFPHRPTNLLAELQVLAARERPGLIIVDTLQRLIRARDLNDYAEVTTKLTPILTLARETGAAVLLVHHAGKGDRKNIDAVLGSTAISGSADNVFILARTERYRVLSSDQRIGAELPEMVLTLEGDGRVLAGPSRHDADRSCVEAAIMAMLAGIQVPVTEPEIGTGVEGSTALKREALRCLFAAGRVSREGKGVKSDPYRYVSGAGHATGSDVPGVSRLLVPGYIQEQENENAISAKTSRSDRADSRLSQGDAEVLDL
jgi:hypothetical protein